MSKLANRVHNGADLLDSRDIIERIKELEDELGGVDEPDEETTDELKALKALENEASDSPDWIHGETLIADSYFETYASELADDIIGAINKDASWPNDCIGWEKAAEELQMDYTSVNYDGVTYWVRSHEAR